MNIHLHTICHNDIDILPFAINYWKKSVSHVFVYLMSSSNDGSKEYLSQFNDFISVIPVADDNELNDVRNVVLKNKAWKASRGKADFVIVTDLDEFIFSNNLENELEYMKNNGMTIVAPEVYHLISEQGPEVLNKSDLLHKQVRYGYYDPKFGKYCIFNPNEIDDINFMPEAHICHPRGNIKYYDKHKIFLLHAKYVGRKRFIEKSHFYSSRLSQMNKENKYGIEHTYNDNILEELFNKKLNNAVNLTFKIM